ncbi:hypothetical protein B0H19DRAFT_1250005 [Mycena capillaripes]|nr:hypothetical protein B0H19DRAFT_1250005 [Mycena capillaripes]
MTTLNLGSAEIAHGPMFLGFAFNAILYGMMILQSHVYMQTHSKYLLLPLQVGVANISLSNSTYVAGTDSRKRAYHTHRKILAIFILDTMSTAFIFAFLYTSLFDNPPYIRSATWDPALTALIAALVQFFFAWRVKKLTNDNIWLCLAVVVCASAGLVGGIVAVADAIINPNFEKLQTPFADMWLGAECIGDGLITVIFWYVLLA